MPGIEKKRILFINHWARQLGGAEWSLLDLLEEAVFRGDVFLVSSEEGALLTRARSIGVTCVSFPCSSALGNVRRGNLFITALRQWRGMLSFAGFILRVRRSVAEIKPHMIHANVPKSHITLFVLRWLGYRGQSCFHIREIFEKRSMPYRLYSLMFRTPGTSVIAISGTVKASLPPVMAAQALVIHNGVTIARPRVYDETQNRPLRFVYLGRVVPWKGCHQLVKTFARLHARYGEKAGSLDLIGDTLYWEQGYRATVQEIIDNKGIGPVCHLLPHTENPLETLSHYDVFCIASIKEPFGRVVAEAQGCGMPVIAYDDGGIVEIVEHNVTGLLVRAGDTEGFVQAMERFIDNPAQMVSMGRAGRERAALLFNRMTQRKMIMDLLVKQAA